MTETEYVETIRDVARRYKAIFRKENFDDSNEVEPMDCDCALRRMAGPGDAKAEGATLRSET